MPKFVVNLTDADKKKVTEIQESFGIGVSITAVVKKAIDDLHTKRVPQEEEA